MFHRHPVCHNLFFALRLPPILARQLAAAAQALGRGAQPPHRLHVTMFILRGLAEVDPTLITTLKTMGGAVKLAPFRVVFDRVVGTDGYVALRPSVRNGALMALHDRLVDLARAAGLAPIPSRFNPHISLIYRGGRTVSQRIAPIEWLADELLLIDSHVGCTKHQVVGGWPLAGEPYPQLSLL